MPTITIPTVIAALLPFVATMLSSWLNDDKLAPGLNALISLCAIILTAVVCELLSADIPLTWPLRLVGVLGYVGVLMNGDLSTLYSYLVLKPSPVASKPPAPVNANPVRVPTALTMPQGSTKMPPSPGNLN